MEWSAFLININGFQKNLIDSCESLWSFLQHCISSQKGTLAELSLGGLETANQEDISTWTPFIMAWQLGEARSRRAVSSSTQSHATTAAPWCQGYADTLMSTFLYRNWMFWDSSCSFRHYCGLSFMSVCSVHWYLSLAPDLLFSWALISRARGHGCTLRIESSRASWNMSSVCFFFFNVRIQPAVYYMAIPL